jgi:uncharacterized protein YkwD
LRALILAGAAAAMSIGALYPPSAQADLRDVVNWARAIGCAGGAARAALRDSSKLRQAAARLESGDSLQAALAAAGYRAAQSATVHLSGAVSEAQLARTLTASYCSVLIDPAFKEMGVEQREHDIWLVLAAPLAVPSLNDADRVNREILHLVNLARANGARCGDSDFAPAAPLAVNSALTDAALAHSRDMAEHGEFDHRGHDGSTPPLRVTRAGYGSYSVVGENIAAGAMTPAEVTQGWLKSPPHCRNIMDPRFTEIGIAFAVNTATAVAVYWTQDFASR